MKYERATGIILRTRSLTETSLIAHWLTPQFGRIATVAKGARRPKSPFRGKLDLFYLADFTFVPSRRSELHILTDLVLRDTHEAIRRDVARLQQVAYAAALIEQTTETQTPMPDEFNLFAAFVSTVGRHAPEPVRVLAFELKWLLLLGLAPELSAASLTASARGIAERLLLGDWKDLSQLKPSDEQTRELKQFLHGFLIYHLGKLPGGRRAALSGG